jgi:hypothetical protein
MKFILCELKEIKTTQSKKNVENYTDSKKEKSPRLLN